MVTRSERIEMVLNSIVGILKQRNKQALAMRETSLVLSAITGIAVRTIREYLNVLHADRKIFILPIYEAIYLSEQDYKQIEKQEEEERNKTTREKIKHDLESKGMEYH